MADTLGIKGSTVRSLTPVAIASSTTACKRTGFGGALLIAADQLAHVCRRALILSGRRLRQDPVFHLIGKSNFEAGHVCSRRVRCGMALDAIFEATDADI